MIKARHNSDVGARGKEIQNDGDKTYNSNWETLARPISTTGKAKKARRMGPCSGQSCSSTFSQEVKRSLQIT